MSESTTLDKILDAIQNNKEKEESGNGGQIGAAIAGILVAIISAIFGYMAWKRGKELAMLKHEKAVAEENVHQAEVDASIAAEGSEKDNALARAQAARTTLDALLEQRNKLEEDHRAAKERINQITDWDAADRYTDSN